MPSPRLGLFGGTFDPPHLGHLVVAVNVRFELRLDRVLLVVAGEPWQKVGTRTITPGPARLAMVEAAVAGVEGLEACGMEVRRPGPSYTADTVAEIARDVPDAELFVILGRDAAQGLPSWERVDALRERVTMVVVDRPGAGDGALAGGFRWLRVESPRLEVSSTDLRARVGDGRPLDFLLPPAVIELIAAEGLYADPGRDGDAVARG